MCQEFELSFSSDEKEKKKSNQKKQKESGVFNSALEGGFSAYAPAEGLSLSKLTPPPDGQGGKRADRFGSALC